MHKEPRRLHDETLTGSRLDSRSQIASVTLDPCWSTWQKLLEIQPTGMDPETYGSRSMNGDLTSPVDSFNGRSLVRNIRFAIRDCFSIFSFLRANRSSTLLLPNTAKCSRWPVPPPYRAHRCPQCSKLCGRSVLCCLCSDQSHRRR